MMLNGVIAALVAITAACGFVAPWAAIVIGARRRRRSPCSACCSSSGSGSTTRSARSPSHGMAGVWGTLAIGFFAVPALAENLATGHGRPRLHGRASTSSASQALGLAAVGAFTFTASFLVALG